jgi:hypothetical protein
MNSFSDVWKIVLEHIQTEYVENNRLSRVAYNLWIDRLEPVSLEGSVATLQVATVFQKIVM